MILMPQLMREKVASGSGLLTLSDLVDLGCIAYYVLDAAHEYRDLISSTQAIYIDADQLNSDYITSVASTRWVDLITPSFNTGYMTILIKSDFTDGFTLFSALSRVKAWSGVYSDHQNVLVINSANWGTAKQVSGISTGIQTHCTISNGSNFKLFTSDGSSNAITDSPNPQESITRVALGAVKYNTSASSYANARFYLCAVFDNPISESLAETLVDDPLQAVL